MKERDLKKQTAINFLILCPVFLIFSLLLSRWWEGRRMDFGAYWQAGHMVLSGQNVYDRTQWEAVRQVYRTAFQSGQTFQYPLPLAILFTLPALLPVQTAYILWMFFAQIAVLISIIILLSFYPARSGYLELLAIAGIFFFRPMFSIINSGQILPFLLLPLAISIWLFHQHKSLAGGFILSILSLKPSFGFSILILTGIWLVFRKQWTGLWGMMAGGLVLWIIGALVNPRWIIDYLNVGENSFRINFGRQPTLWGAVDKIFVTDSVSLIIGMICVAIVLVMEIHLLWRDKSRIGSLNAFASIVPTALLVAPYSWNYDQVLLIVPIIFLLINISMRYRPGKAALFMLGIVVFAFAMVVVAYSVGHDVWSYLNSVAVWIFSLYFVAKKDQLSYDA